MAGDQAGYVVGRRGGSGLIDRLGSRAALIARARDLLAQRCNVAVFLSRWLVSALGPYVNFAAGATGLPWSRFTLWSVLGEIPWFSLYIGLGYTFTGNLEAASALAVRVLTLVGAGALAIGLGLWLRAALRAE